MAIGLTVYRGQHLIASASLEREASKLIELTDEYFYGGRQDTSAKSSWNQLLANYNYTVVMMISNLLCRTLTAHGIEPEAEPCDRIHSAAIEEGKEECQLGEDELEQLYQARFNHLHQVFSHYGVNSIAHDIASALQNHRELSRLELLEMLEDLRML